MASYFVHPHASVVCISSEAKNHQSLLLRQDGLIHGPAASEMRKQERHVFPSSPGNENTSEQCTLALFSAFNEERTYG